MSARSCAANLEVYRRPEVAAHYADLNYLSPCEVALFQKYLRPGVAVLDIGVGGGRTSEYLSSIASRYVGIDYSPSMIAECRRRFPNLDFRQMDAANLSSFPDSSFGAVVIAFNGLDYLTEESRKACLAHCERVLARDGVLIFSSHNPRAVLVWPEWNRRRVREIAQRAPGAFFKMLTVTALAAVAAVRGTVRAVWASSKQIAQRAVRSAFWKGEGYILDSAHGGLVTHYAIPNIVVDELRSLGFDVRECAGDTAPRRSIWFTGWYYYACIKRISPQDIDAPTAPATEGLV